MEVVSGQFQYVSPQERKILENLVHLWQCLGVSFKHVQPSDAASATSKYILDPPIDELVLFSEGDRTSKIKNPILRLGDTAKGIICSQLEALHVLDGPNGEGFTQRTRAKTAEEVHRQQEKGVEGLVGGAGAGTSDYVPSDRWKVCLEDGAASATLSESDKRKVDQIAGRHKAGGKPAVGAFLRHAGAKSSKRRRTTRELNKSAVVFKFKAGFTNAVRRPVVLDDLL